MWLKILQAIIALPEIAKFVEKWATALMSVIKKYQKQQQRDKASEARNKSEKAKTKEEREDAARSWFDALRGK